MKKLLSLVLAIAMLMMFSVPASASSYANGWNGGEKLNFNPLNYHTTYTGSDWSKDLTNKYGLKWYENPTRFVLKGEAMLLQLRTVQASLIRRGYKQISANGETLNNFNDKDSLVPNAQEEAKILKAIGILSGTSNSYMNMSDYTTRAEVAKIVTVMNQSVLGIPVQRSDNPFTDISYNWAKDYITQAYQTGIMDGVESNRFYPDNAITLERLLDTIDNEVGYYGITLQDVATAMNETFKVTYNLNPIRISSEYASYNVKKYYETQIKVNVYPSTSKDLVFTSLDESICTVTSVNQYLDTVTVKGLKVGMTYIKVNLKDEPNYFTIVPVYVTNNTVNATGITTNNNVSVEVGDSYYLTSTVQPYDTTDKTVQYTSSDTSIATVNSYGKVVGINKGTAVITAQTHNGYKAYCVVTVTNQYTSTVPATGITVNNNISIQEDSSYYLTTTVQPYNATNKSVFYYTTNSNIAKVSYDGKVTGVSEGTAIITVQTHNGYTAYCTVTVTDKNVPATGITVTSSLNLETNASYYLTTSVLPYNATNKSVVYYSSDSSIAAVNSDGKVTGINRGTATITAKSHNGYKAYCTVTVTDKNIPATGISVTSNLNLGIGSVYYLNTVVSPSNATNKSVTYYSNNVYVASVDSYGKVTGVGSGTAVITVQTHNGYQAYCTVTVADNNVQVTGITMVANVTLKVADRYTISANVSPSNATDKTIKYRSDNSNIAAVNSSGVITGINEGTTVITAESSNGYKAYCTVTVSNPAAPTETKRSYIHVNGYEESSYYNAFNNENITFIVETDLGVNSVNLSNDNCYVSQGVTKHSSGWQFTVKSKTLSQNGETLLTVTLGNGQQLTVRICIYP